MLPEAGDREARDTIEIHDPSDLIQCVYNGRIEPEQARSMSSQQFKHMGWKKINVRPPGGAEESYQRTLEGSGCLYGLFGGGLILSSTSSEAVRYYHLGERKDTVRWARRAGFHALDYLSGDWLDRYGEDKETARAGLSWVASLVAGLAWLIVIGDRQEASRLASFPIEESAWNPGEPEFDARSAWWFVIARHLVPPAAPGLMTPTEATDVCADLIRNAKGKSRETRRMNRAPRAAFEALVALQQGTEAASAVFNEKLGEFITKLPRDSMVDVLPFELTLVAHVARERGVSLNIDPDLARWLVDLDNI